jgi:hypothetical protein
VLCDVLVIENAAARTRTWDNLVSAARRVLRAITARCSTI